MTFDQVAALIAAQKWFALFGLLLAYVIHLVQDKPTWINEVRLLAPVANLSDKTRAIVVLVVTIPATAFSTAVGWVDVGHAMLAQLLLSVPSILKFLLELNQSARIARVAARAAMKIAPVALLLLAVGSAGTGCAFLKSVVPVLDDVIVAVEDGSMVLDAIEAAVSIFFAAKPDAATQAKIEQAVTDARLALDVALRAARGAAELTAEQADAAFADFRKLYDSLVALLTQAGIASPAPDGKTLTASARAGGSFKVPVPLAITGKVSR